MNSVQPRKRERATLIASPFRVHFTVGWLTLKHQTQESPGENPNNSPLTPLFTAPSNPPPEPHWLKLAC